MNKPVHPDPTGEIMINPTVTHRTLRLAAVMIAGTAMLAATIVDAAPNRARVRGQNGVVAAGGGPNGGYVRGAGAVRNSEGGVTAASGGAFATRAGAEGGRASTTTVNTDGSARRLGGFAASGARGSVAGNSDLAIAADGTRTGTTNTTATNAAGNSYNGSTTINSANGRPVRTATCTDPAGNAIACPR
jgi:hypothetical protein